MNKVKKSLSNISEKELESLLAEISKIPKITEEAIIIISSYSEVVGKSSSLIFKPKLENTSNAKSLNNKVKPAKIVRGWRVGIKGRRKNLEREFKNREGAIHYANSLKAQGKGSRIEVVN